MLTIEEKIEKTVQWLRDKVEEAHAKGLIVGVSGGIDSAVVACLIKKAFPEDSMGVIMPIKNTDEDIEDGIKCVKACGIRWAKVDLTEQSEGILNKVKSALSENDILKEEYIKMTDANIRARLRMTSLYGIANNLGYLVVGTDNSAEVYTGYFTKYGDGGVDILPIANISKHEVYEWGKVLGVPESVLKKAPSAGLWEGQTDENEMGTTYAYIDAVVSGREDEVPEKDLKIIKNLHSRSEHKRNMPPHGPKF